MPPAPQMTFITFLEGCRASVTLHLCNTEMQTKPFNNCHTTVQHTQSRPTPKSMDDPWFTLGKKIPKGTLGLGNTLGHTMRIGASSRESKGMKQEIVRVAQAGTTAKRCGNSTRRCAELLMILNACEGADMPAVDSAAASHVSISQSTTLPSLGGGDVNN